MPLTPHEITHIHERPGLLAVGISKTFGKRPVIQQVSLTFDKGEIVGLLGPNGAGKTTCFAMMSGLLQPDTGAIFLNGEDITHLPMYRRARMGVGYLPQEASIFRGLNVEENIRAVLEPFEKDADKRDSKVESLLAEFDISHLKRSSSVALSGGERRRLEIARALAVDPQFILLDEPFAGIDPIAVQEIRELITHLKTRGIGVLITDHSVRETLEIVDRAYIMHEGKILKEGTPKEIIQDPLVRQVYLGEHFTMPSKK